MRSTNERVRMHRRNGSTASANKVPLMGHPCLIPLVTVMRPTTSPAKSNKLSQSAYNCSMTRRICWGTRIRHRTAISHRRANDGNAV